VAVVRIRWISVLSSIIISSLFQYIGSYIFEAYPFIFGLFHKEESVSVFEEFKANPYVLIYLLLPGLAIVITLTVKVYATFINNQMDHASLVFVIAKSDLSHNFYETKHSFSVLYAVGILFVIFVTIIQSFCSRKIRLLVHCPVQVLLVTILLPVTIIRTNRKIRLNFVPLWSERTQVWANYFWILVKKMSSKRILPSDN
jgi:hypothetical protein